MGADEQGEVAIHLCVLIHGLWGTPNHLDHVANTLREEYPEAPLRILQPKTNVGNFTYDGIELGAERITKEIEDELESAEKTGKPVKKLSIVGYSMGGLVARYSIGLLYAKGWFDKLEPTNFATFATPHLGTRSPQAGWRGHFFNTLASRSLSVSGRQLWTTDNFRETGHPLLAVLADPARVFIHALSAFQYRSLYANIVNDRSVPYYTAYISHTDPYVDLNKVDVHYLPDTDDIIVDPAQPTIFKTKPLTLLEYLGSVQRAVVLKAPLLFFMTFVLPIGFTVFLVNAGVQSFRSAQRIRLHEQGRGGVGLGAYRLPLLLENMQRRAEGALEEGYLTNAEASKAAAAGSSSASSSSDPKTNSALVEKDGEELATDAAGFPLLALTPEQLAMADSLNSVGFEKFAVHIHNVNHSHAAIVLRKPQARLSEGKVVVRHWAEHFVV